MTVRALFSMGVNVLGGIYVYIHKIIKRGKKDQEQVREKTFP